MNKQIQAMRQLGMSMQEIEDVIECDRQIDQGAKLFELTDEQKQVVKKMSGTGTKTVYQFQKRERKVDECKQGLIELLAEVVKKQPMCNSLEITNPEREFLFMWAGKKYKVVLSAPRG